jgi:uncharacterized membrane protein (UPF0127 family)
MSSPDTGRHDRLASLPRARALGVEVPVARSRRARLLGLTRLDRSEAGAGLLIERCQSVHTFGMRFPLDLYFLDARRRPLACRRVVGPRRVVGLRRAAHVLELPSPHEPRD